MTTGHLNPGYKHIVSRILTEANNDAETRPAVLNRVELDRIKAKARSVWSAKSNAETTYGAYHDSKPPFEVDVAVPRPSSPTRRNNPHPHLVFLTARLKAIPGYFNSTQTKSQRVKDHEQEFLRIMTSYEGDEMKREKEQHEQRFKSKTISHFRNANHYVKSLPREEAVELQAHLNYIGINMEEKKAPQLLSASTANLNHFENDKSTESFVSFAGSNKSAASTKSQFHLQSNMANPYLYNDYRVYKEKYALQDHGLPHGFAHKPTYRRDFVIHPDWHAGLKHHRLPYY